MTSTMPAPAGSLAPGTQVQVGEHLVAIDRFLSEGGYAHVYRVQSQKPINGMTQHVLKRLAVPDKPALQEVRHEVDVMKALRGHRNIINFIEIYILMELASGGGIIDMMNTRLSNRLTESEILKVFSDTVEAVAHMHAQSPPLIHRDLKVENILMSSSNLYKLCDFGSTTVELPRPPQTVPEIQALELDLNKHTTLQYRAPEMCDVWSRKPIGPAADVWALGVLLYKLCYYTTPFEEQGVLAIQNVTYKFPHHPAYSSAIKELICFSDSASERQADPRARLSDARRSTEMSMSAAAAPSPPQRAKDDSKAAYDAIVSKAAESVTANDEALKQAITPMRRGRPGKVVDSPIASTSAMSVSVAAPVDPWDVASSSNARSPPLSSGFGDTFAPTAPKPQPSVPRHAATLPTAAPFPDLAPPQALHRDTPSPNLTGFRAAAPPTLASRPSALNSAVFRSTAEASRAESPSHDEPPLPPRPTKVSEVAKRFEGHDRGVQTSPRLLASYIAQNYSPKVPPASPKIASMRGSPALPPQKISSPSAVKPVVNLLTGDARDEPVSNGHAERTLSAPAAVDGLPRKASKPAHLSGPVKSASTIPSAPRTAESSEDETPGPEDAGIRFDPTSRLESASPLPLPSRADTFDEETPGGSFDLDRALSSIRKFAPAGNSQSTIKAPAAESTGRKAAIGNLVSRYETLSTDPEEQKKSTRPQGPRLPSSHSRSGSTVVAEEVSTSASSFVTRFPALDAPASRSSRPSSSQVPFKPQRIVSPQPPVAKHGDDEDEDEGLSVAARKAKWEAGQRRTATVPSSDRRREYGVV